MSPSLLDAFSLAERSWPAALPPGSSVSQAPERVVQHAPSKLTPLPKVAGLVKLSTTDWPGKLAAVVFLQGCPWRCTYCHNEAILDARAPGALEWGEVLEFLERRRGLLDGVVFSGGEPLLDTGLAGALPSVRELGFQTALHTGGAWPRRLAHLLDTGLLDWVGLDIKHLRHKYHLVTGVRSSGPASWGSLDVVVQSGVAHEVRTTVDPSVHDREDIKRLISELREYRSANGNQVSSHVLQEAQPKGAAEKHLTALPNWRLADLIAATEEPEVLRRAA